MSFSNYYQVNWTSLDELPALGTPLCLHFMLAIQEYLEGTHLL